MTAPASAAPTVKAYLVQLFQSVMDADTNAVDQSPLVSYNEPDTADTPSDVVWIGNVSRQFHPIRMVGTGGALWGNETLTIDVNVSVLNQDIAGAQACEVRLWHVVGLLEAAVRSDPSLGGVAIQAYPDATDSECEWDADYTRWEASAVLKIHVEAVQ